jgi:hypothetical protein
MLKHVLFGVLLLFVTVAGADAPDRTGGDLNGRFWQALPLLAKAGFSAGFNTATGMNLVVSSKNREDYRIGRTNGDLVRGLDEFYRLQDVKMPIWIAIRIVKMENDGFSIPEIADKLAQENIWNNIVPAPPEDAKKK